MKITIFTAHPGDSIFAAGGTLARYVDEGHEVVDICVTLGQALRPDLPEDVVARIRNENREKAAKIIGYSDVRNLGYRDMELPYNREIVGKFVNILREEKPDIILTYWWQNVHPDIRNLVQALCDATIFSAFHYDSAFPPHMTRKMYQFASVNSVNYEPEFFIDITEYVERKREAINQFGAEDELIRQWEGPQSKGLADQILSANRSHGQMSGVPYAEGFREFFAVETKSRALRLLPI
jgi:LmbE family N-acetylglucosaminyl deacetylase